MKKTELNLDRLRDFPFLERIPIDKRGAALLKLGQWQLKRHGTSLEAILAARCPEPMPNATPVIPVHTDMTEEQLGKFISRPPERQEKID